MSSAVPSPATERGLFLTLEGVDGGGKDTQLERLTAWLSARGHIVRSTREPEGTPLGQAVGGWLRGHVGDGPVPAAEALLFLAARAQHVAQVIRPALERGETVVCSRFSHSTLAYQCHGLGLDEGAVRVADAFARDGIWPDGVIVLDVPPEVAAARRAGRGTDDRIESRHVEFHRRVRAGFQALAAAEPSRVRLIDATGESGAIHAQIVAQVECWLTERAQ